jgi:replicative DNA helicase
VSPLTVAGIIEKEQPDLVLIDFLSKMKGGGAGDDWQALGRISGDLQTLAQQYQIPIAAGSQINRMGAGKEPPNAENLAQSDKIGQDADLLVTIAPRSARVLHSKIAKNRHGASGLTWYSHFDPGKGIYTEISGDKAGELIERDKEIEDDASA